MARTRFVVLALFMGPVAVACADGIIIIAEQTLAGRTTQYEWAPIAFEFTAPAGPVKIRVGYSHDPGAGDSVYLDDALVVEQTAATP